MTLLIDTHCHLADPAFDADRDAVLARASAAGVGHVVAVGESPERAEQVRALARRYAGVSATAGLHPHDARRWSAEIAQRLEEALADPVVVAVGETGLDYHYDNSPRPEQREAFDAQLELATRTGKPAVIHAREADDDVSAILRSHPGVVAILHSFSSGRTLFETAVALGHYVSWSGMVTFRNWNRDDLVREVPEDRLLVETDAPYLAPVPHRGTRNEPAFVRATAERVAEVVGWDVEECIARTGANARRAFGDRLAQDQRTRDP